MPFVDYLRLATIYIPFLIPFSLKLLLQTIAAKLHSRSYTAGPCPRNIVVVGGSFAGVELAKRLAHTVPSGYRVVLVEKNSHFNWLFTLPRFSVVPGHEHKGFIPYDGVFCSVPHGSVVFERGVAVEITKEHVRLGSGKLVPYGFLAMATGSQQAPPSKLAATDRGLACEELRIVQAQISEAKSIAVVGGGPVGIELATDIKTFFPDKTVSLFHSRDQLLPHFGARLHAAVLKTLGRLGVETRLAQRPTILPDGQSLRLLDGTIEEYDLIIPATGQKPNSELLKDIAPHAVSYHSGRVLVEPTLQIQDPNLPNVYALGDVAETGGPRMARAGAFQADIVAKNIVATIRGSTPMTSYEPFWPMEGAIMLTLGKSDSIIYAPIDGDRDILIEKGFDMEDHGIERAWRMMGTKYVEGSK